MLKILKNEYVILFFIILAVCFFPFIIELIFNIDSMIVLKFIFDNPIIIISFILIIALTLYIYYYKYIKIDSDIKKFKITEKDKINFVIGISIIIFFITIITIFVLFIQGISGPNREDEVDKSIEKILKNTYLDMKKNFNSCDNIEKFNSILKKYLLKYKIENSIYTSWKEKNIELFNLYKDELKKEHCK
jgi:hypothetical protein